MYFLYSLALSILFLALLPYFLFQSVRHGKYAGSFKQRIGLLPDSLRGDGSKTIWVHAVSVGEFLAARSLIDALKKELPDCRIVISTTTRTGQTLARAQSGSVDGVFYFPFDWTFVVRRVLRIIRPSMVIILETEVWPNFLRECRRRNVTTVLANGRLSIHSFRRYLRVRGFMHLVMNDFSLLLMQSPVDVERATGLGAAADRVHECGNLKYDSVGDGGWVGEDSKAQPPIPISRGDIDHQFWLSLSPHLIVAGSTAPGEEEMLLASLREVRRQPGLEDSRLLLAPRHPERFEEVARLIGQSEFTLARRSQSRPPTDVSSVSASIDLQAASGPESDAKKAHRADVILLDTIGELASAYSLASVVFVGGSMVPRGGHNIIEPAAFAKPIVVGPYTDNFKQVVSEFARAGAVVQIAATAPSGENALANELIRLLANIEEASTIGARAHGILLANRGATARTIAAIKGVASITNRARGGP